MLDPDFTDKLKKKLKIARDIISEVEKQLDEQTGPPANSPKPDSGLNPYLSTKAPARVEHTLTIPVEMITSAGKGARVVASARKHTGKPYQWGGTGNPSFDCSGLTQFAYRDALGIDIGRTTYDQIKNGKEVAFEDAQDGDLIFSNFSAPNRPEHVSINIAGPDKVFEAGDPIGEYPWGNRGTVTVKRYV